MCFGCFNCVLYVPNVFCVFEMCFACSKCVSVVSPIVFCMFQMCFGCSNCVLYVPNVFCMSQMCFACSKCVSVVSIVFCMFQMYFQSVYCVNICLKCVKHCSFCVLHLWATVRWQDGKVKSRIQFHSFGQLAINLNIDTLQLYKNGPYGLYS